MKSLASDFFLLFENVVDPPLVRPDLLVVARQHPNLPVPGDGWLPGHRCSDLSPESPAQRRRHRVANLFQHLILGSVELVNVRKPLEPRLLPQCLQSR